MLCLSVISSFSGRLRAGLKRAVLNQLLMFVVMLAAWPVVEKLDLPFRDPLPSLSVFLRDMFVIVMVEEVIQCSRSCPCLLNNPSP